MRIHVDIQPEIYWAVLHELIRAAFPGAELCRAPDPAADMCLALVLPPTADPAVCHITGAGAERRSERMLPLTDEPTRRRLARLWIYHELCAYLGRDINPYGILTGVRPVKVVHRLLDQGMTEQDIHRVLREDYAVGVSKRALLLQVASHNRAILAAQQEDARGLGLYLGIPFCPGKCDYCSFPGAVLSDYEAQIKPFLNALQRELAELAAEVNRREYHLSTLYLGGGTPTILRTDDLADLFARLKASFRWGPEMEFTVEAGRPDTLNRDTWALFKEAGVNRVCINPQSMHDETLRAIGRGHDAAAVEAAFRQAREAGPMVVNMDLILGLPGEGPRQHRDSGERVLALRPDNITVHSLAVKRGSRLAEREGRGRAATLPAVEQSVHWFRGRLEESGYQPYYLYRQKYMQANVENIGYALPGTLSRYNIQIMEERQSVLALGGGASSKFVRPGDLTLSQVHNPKDPQTYCRDIERLIAAKVDKLRGND